MPSDPPKWPVKSSTGAACQPQPSLLAPSRVRKATAAIPPYYEATCQMPVQSCQDRILGRPRAELHLKQEKVALPHESHSHLVG